MCCWGNGVGGEIGKGVKAETLRAYMSGAEGIRARFHSLHRRLGQKFTYFNEFVFEYY